MKNRIIKSIYRFAADHGWLKSWHIFSFADYYDPSNMHFGNMRVFNDDFIEWKSGFWMHAHSNMEILTIMLEWEITHTDNMWNKATIKKWQIQTMSAWTWIRHSEENRSDKLVHLYQIWFLPTHNWNTPEYKDIDIKIENNKLNLLASNIEQEWLWYLDSDVKVYYWKYYKYEAFEYTLEKNRWLFLYMYKWELIINKTVLKEWDQLRFELEWIYDFISNSIDCEFVLIDVKL